MSKNNVASMVKLSSLDDLFGNTNTSNDIDNTKEQIIEVPISDLHTFSNHPFRVLDDERMDETVESIREHGVLVPGIVRRRTKGGYEIIAGHRRKRACEIIGLETMPVFVRDLTDDEAVIVMVDSNIQREEILPSEKAKAYKMKYEAMKHQGENSGKQSLVTMSEESGESRSKVQRYIRIADLNEGLLDLIDEKKMGIAQGVDLSMLKPEEQEMTNEIIEELNVIPSMLQSALLKEASARGALNPLTIREILVGEKKDKPRSFSLKGSQLSEFFPENYTNEQINDIIIKLLKDWKQNQ